MKQITFGIVILGAGRSERMGRPKLLLPWHQTSVLGHLIQTWLRLAVRQVAVVCASGAREIADELNRLDFPEHDRIFNATPERGMFSSIQCAASWRGWGAELTHWIISLGDQPHLRTDTLRALLDFSRRNPFNICQPLRNGRHRHPVSLPKAIFLNIGVSSARDLKEFLSGYKAEWADFESDDPGLDLDLDTPADYDRARRLDRSLDE